MTLLGTGTRLVDAPSAASAADRILLEGLTQGPAPIGLADVDAAAGLQTRVDQKYLVSLGVLDRLIRGLGPGLQVLEIEGLRVFEYLSVYFDTASLGFFRDHRQGRRVRHKVRTRNYVDTGQAMLEVKAKGARGETVKHRIPWHEELLDRLSGHDLADGEGFVDGHLLGRPRSDELAPSLVSRYRRATFVDPAAGVRLTCDIELSFDGLDAGATVGAGGVLLETKSATGRSAADMMLHRIGVRPSSISKYCVGIALTAGQRAPRWGRVLRRLEPRFSGPATA